jgi:hypothetical protein
MAEPNGHVVPSESSPLLSKGISGGIEASSIPAPNSTTQVLPNKAANGVQTNGAQDEEAGEGDEPVNPLYEGLPEAAARLHILAPAVAIGVSRGSITRYGETAYKRHRSFWQRRIRQSLYQRTGRLVRNLTH